MNVLPRSWVLRPALALSAALLIVASHTASAVATTDLNLPQLGEPADVNLSPAQEREIGASVAAEIYRENYTLDDLELNDYVNAIGEQLAGASKTKPPPVHLFVVRDPRINAFALPGGFIGLNVGTLMVADNESELAGVLGHELAHITQRHIARSIGEGQAGTIATWLGVIAAIIAGSANPDVVMGALGVGQAINYQRQVSYTRAHEQEADRIGIQTMAAAGFDPRGMADFFEKLAQESRLYGNRVPELLLTHPLSTNRMAEAEARAAELGPIHHQDSLEFGLMQARARVLVADNPADALNFYTRQLAAGRNSLDNRYGMALAQFTMSQIPAALDTLSPLAEQYPKQANVQLLYAQILEQNGHLDTALDVYGKLLQLYPQYAPAMLDYAQALMDANRPDDARQYLISHDQSQGTQPETYRLLAQAARQSNNYPEAAYQMGTYLLTRGDPGSALEQIDAGLRLPGLTPQERARLVAKRAEVRAQMPDRYGGGDGPQS
ncbi:M48 family metalloprotease [Solimonas marina]|uniref:M48 family metallopeptidase n=1 Tax=Solimonas marina TaxID=2714601 RepID=A0A969W8Q9_9GAMM|nr:M48 family metalloprotease [Solimonas marina]NKF22697.1 M48 family metallopeptidase [Solimonas marina]